MNMSAKIVIYAYQCLLSILFWSLEILSLLKAMKCFCKQKFFYSQWLYTDVPLQVGSWNVTYISMLIFIFQDCIYSMEYLLNLLFHVQENLVQIPYIVRLTKKSTILNLKVIIFSIFLHAKCCSLVNLGEKPNEYFHPVRRKVWKFIKGCKSIR
jgi:hypothetical protein